MPIVVNEYIPSWYTRQKTGNGQPKYKKTYRQGCGASHNRLGYIREKDGSILAAVLLHAMLDMPLVFMGG
ncbi:CPBP family intramembrane glutamic endopeptidase [Spongiimicrobium sp. 2-473A-2-J]|uniref:CPBP family intramembrane glutamic endopeptidase n=1 Tax=Eudoraea algarum TaxID=3417568 RepID=UPI003D36AFAC